MRRQTKVKAAAAIVLAASMGCSTVLATVMTAMIGRNELAYTDRAEEGQPWEVSVGIAMGAFRGIFVNFLWIRANSLKEAGKYYEAIELASAITRLQPRFPRVWVFHGWNLAYNVSVATQTREERWQWVNAGIRLLREQGIPANPNDMLLHKELGWFFLHKIGGYTDDANPYYKRQLAAEWTINLGTPPPAPPGERDREAAIERYVEWLEPITNSPATLDGVIERNPQVETLVNRLGAIPMPISRELLFRREAILAFNNRAEISQIVERMGPRSQALKTLMEDASLAEAWGDLLAYIRKRVLIDEYNMEPERMIRYTRYYGPLDWRHHAAHSLYWSARGVEMGEARVTERNKRDFDFINTDRIVIQSVQDLFRSGNMYFDFAGTFTPGEPFMQMVPNPYFVDTYGKIVKSRDMENRSWADIAGDRGYRPYIGGYENFLKDAVSFFYARGDIAEAQKWYTELGTMPEQNVHYKGRPEEFSIPLAEFVNKELTDRLSSPYIMQQQVAGALHNAYVAGLLQGDLDLFRAQIEYAKRVHRFFFEEQYRTTNVDRGTARMEQMDSDFRMIAGVFFVQLMQSLGLEDAETVYDRAPNDLRQFAYDALRDTYKEFLDKRAAGGVGRTFDQVFPEPRDMQAFRGFIERQAPQQPNATIEAR